MLLQAPGDTLDNCDQLVVCCPASMSASIAVAAALNLMSADEYIRRALVEKLLADGLAVDLSLEQSAEGYH
jgi:hypothetical protein